MTDPKLVADFVLPIKTLSEANRSHNAHHWALRHKRVKQAHDIVSKVGPAYVRASDVRLPAVVKLTRLSAGELDDDNVRAACKHVRDAIATWFGIDDKHSDVLAFDYVQQKCKRGEYGVRVQIYERAWLVHRIVPAAELANDVQAEGVRRAGWNGRRGS